LKHPGKLRAIFEKTKASLIQNHMTTVCSINPDEPQPEMIREAADAIQRGGVVVFPTRCLYGLGADAMNSEAVDRVFDLKQRPAHNPILVLIDRRSELVQLVKSVPTVAKDLMDYFWPGRITLVFEAAGRLPVNLTAGTGKIGIRMPGHGVARSLAKAVKSPITGTSANLSGQPGCSHIKNLEPQVAHGLDLILDAGRLKGGVGSTVVDVSAGDLKILREGEVKAQKLFAL
jgi:L-threonylcarbamoyladenylate synthase